MDINDLVRMCRYKMSSIVIITPILAQFIILPTFISTLNINQASKSAPKLLPIPLADSYLEGTPIAMLCTISNGLRDGLSFHWLKDGKQLASNDEQHHSITSDAISSRIYIRSVKANDAGEYTCVARNQHGQDRISSRLVVNVELKWVQQPMGMSVSLGQDAVIECSAQGEPKPLIQWSRLSNVDHSRVAAANGKVQMNEPRLGSNPLKLSSTRLEDAALYECVASNNIGELRQVVKVDVL
ncbi:Hemicentin-1, partial [Fragariocoptes setiger]